MGQSALVLQVGMQAIPIGVCPQVHPIEPGGQSATVQSPALAQAFGPIMPPSPGIPPSGCMMPPPAPFGVPLKQPRMYGKPAVTW
jgi:hypothetical protein